MQEHFVELDRTLRKECVRLGLPSDVETPETQRSGQKRISAPKVRERTKTIRQDPFANLPAGPTEQGTF